MAQQMTATNPVSDLMYDWLTVMQNKAEGVNAYEKYILDAEDAGCQESIDLFRRLHETDVRMLEEIKDHVCGMMAKEHGRA